MGLEAPVGMMPFAAAVFIAGLAVAVRAIVLARRAERSYAALAESQAMLAESQRIANMGSFQWNVRTNELVWSDQVYRMFGFDPAFRPTYESYLAAIHPEDREQVLQTIRAALTGRAPYQVRQRIVRPDGEVRTLDARGEVSFSATGAPLKMVGICQDVTAFVRLEEAASDERRKQREVLDSMFSFVALFSTQGDLLDVNRAAIEGLGRTRAELIGQKIWDIGCWSHSPEIQAASRNGIERAAKGEVVRGDYQLCVADDTFIVADVTFSPLRDRDGRVVEVVASAMDVTERVKAEQASQLVRLQLEQAQRIANVGSWEWEFESGKLSWSEQCFRIAGWDPQAGAPTLERFLKAVHRDDHEAVTQAISAARRAGKACDFEHRVIWPCGTVRVVHQLGEVKRDASGRLVRMIGTTQDITEQRAVRTELEASRIRAEAANRAKSQFVANMSHELRTPLNAIIGFSELLQNDELELSDERRREYARDINAGGKHLLAVINDILEISRIEAGKVALEEETLGLAELIDAALRMVGPRADEMGVALSSSAPVDATVICDQRLMLQALLNLLSNAVKFTERGGRVDISARPSEDGGLDIAVRDTGIGMSAQDVARVGEPFLQVDGRLSRKFEGTGLGLVISKRLIELHGAKLGIESRLDDGTTMTIALPASRVSYARSGVQAAAAS